ncbi:MAG: response regulator [Magnetococcales bacterium]|nr:response regulator [Magnetococcales bacterium]
MKILIVDDEANNRLLLSQLLASHGDCDLAVNGREAVEAFELSLADGEPYDLICLDIMMPEMDGQAALKKIRALEEEFEISGDTIIFMTTALDTEEHVVKAFFHGHCTDYLAKPISRESLEEKLNQYNLIAG